MSFLRSALRFAVSVSLALLVLSLMRWGPVFAEPPFDVRALPLAGLTLVLAVAAALVGGESRPGPWRSLGLGLVAAALALAFVVWLRPPAGLAAEVSDPRGVVATLPPGPVDVAGPDLAALPHVRKWSFLWEGEIRAPQRGVYTLWAEGRGAVEVAIDGYPVLRGEGELFRADAEVPLGEGRHAIRVESHRTGPGPRLRLGWRTPAWPRRSEAIPPRFLGPERARVLWLLTDVLAALVAVLAGAFAWVLPWAARRSLPAPTPVERHEVLVSLVGHAAVVAAMSWPLVTNLVSSGVMDRPDGRLNAWILAWDVHALLHEPSRLFQAPIFHPLPDALAFSENLLLPAVLVAPAILAKGPVLGYNLALLGSLVISGLGAQLLVRRVSGDRWAAFVAGAFFAAGPHRWIRLAHLHAQVTLFMPFVLLALDRFWERRSLRRALEMGVGLALQGLSSVYLGVITATAAVSAAVLAFLAGLRGRELARLAGGFLFAGAILAPAVWPYLRMRQFQGREWTMDEVRTHAATLESYAASGTPLYGGLTQRHLSPDRVRDALFPGVVPLLLGIAGLAAAPRRYRAAAVALSAIAVVISLGPETAVYRFLYDHVIFLRGVRALARFSLVPVLCLAVLVGLGLAGRRRLALVAFVAILAESSHVPLRYVPYAPPSAAARWLAGREGAIVALPLGERDTDVMLDGVVHFRPLVNGDSGFVPVPYTRAMELLESPLTTDALRFLRSVDVRHVVAREEMPLPLAARFGEDRIYEVPPGESASTVERGRPCPARATPDGVVVDLGGRPGIASRLGFEMTEAPWVGAPQIAVSDDGSAWTGAEGTASLADATLSLMKDPRRGLGEIRLPPGLGATRFIRLDPRLPMRPGTVWVSP
jgi:hypothetical protein